MRVSAPALSSVAVDQDMFEVAILARVEEIGDIDVSDTDGCVV